MSDFQAEASYTGEHSDGWMQFITFLRCPRTWREILLNFTEISSQSHPGKFSTRNQAPTFSSGKCGKGLSHASYARRDSKECPQQLKTIWFSTHHSFPSHTTKLKPDKNKLWRGSTEMSPPITRSLEKRFIRWKYTAEADSLDFWRRLT